jgi:hypothetical protein
MMVSFSHALWGTVEKGVHGHWTKSDVVVSLEPGKPGLSRVKIPSQFWNFCHDRRNSAQNASKHTHVIHE